MLCQLYDEIGLLCFNVLGFRLLNDVLELRFFISGRLLQPLIHIEPLPLHGLLEACSSKLLSLLDFLTPLFPGKFNLGAQVFSLLLPLLLLGLNFRRRQFSAAIHQLFVHFVEDISDGVLSGRL